MNIDNDNQKNDYSDLLLEIKDFYNSIIDEIIELMNLYNCKTPLEIYCLYNMISSCFVNEEELFNHMYAEDKASYSMELENYSIKGVNVLLNGGVCRHKSAMLNDIYNKMGIDSVIMVGYLKSFINFHYGNYRNKQIADSLYVNNMLRKIDEGANIEDFKNNLKRRKISYNIQDLHDDYFKKHIHWPNHAIVMAGVDKGYYFDSTNDTIYYKDVNDIITLRNRSGLYFSTYKKIMEFYWERWLGNYQELKEKYDRIIHLPCDNLLETIQNIKEINLYLDNNREEVDEFVKRNMNSIESIKGKCKSLLN